MATPALRGVCRESRSNFKGSIKTAFFTRGLFLFILRGSMNYFILYFFAGILEDFLFTLNLRYVTEKRVVHAVIASFFVTVVGLLVFYDILTRLDEQRSIVGIVMYALGIAVGTFLGMKFKPGFKQ